jgi:hypothetical protein
VLAKGGLFTKPESETTAQQNQEVIDQFFKRQPDTVIRVESLTGIRDIVEKDADLVPKEITKRLSMEYDWKRQPTAVQVSPEYDHIYFSTRPWKTIDQFKQVRQFWTEFTKGDPHCVKTVEDFDTFADYLECRALSPEKSKYLRKNSPDIHRLRQALCSAWQHSEAGLVKTNKMTAREFATTLESIGIPCKRTDVENGKKKPFEPNTCPPTRQTIDLLNKVKLTFPKLKATKLLMKTKTRDSVTIRI